MAPSAEVLLVPRFIILLCGLIVPGSALMRALHVRPTLAASFAGSAFAQYVTVLALQLAGIPVSMMTIGAGLLVFTLIARRMSGLTPRTVEPDPTLLTRSRHYNPVTGMGAWSALYLPFLLVVIWRAWLDPLAGPDIEFRWSFLAEQMRRLGSLDFYPPRSAADFLSYFWVESIPPGIAALHGWAYACAGRNIAAWTIPAVVLQLWAIHALIWDIAERLGGVRAARLACLAAAACPFLTWSILLNQETGLTALSMAGVAFGVLRWSQTLASRWAAFAGVFAVLGASAREYGLVFPLLAATGLFVTNADRRAWMTFLPFAVISIIWPLRTLILTGNPFYSLPIAAGLPVNERFVAWLEHEAEVLGQVLRTADGWSDTARYLLLYAGMAVLGWVILAIATVRRKIEAALAFTATLAVLGLWAASVRYTNGGLFYSLRVTSPALVLGAIATGTGIAALLERRENIPFAARIAIATVSLVMLPATLALPANPLRTPAEKWPAFARSAKEETDPCVALILPDLQDARARERAVVLADAPGFQRRFQPAGIKVAPLWSPQADWLFDAGLTPAEVARKWRESGVTHLIVTKWQSNLQFLDKYSRWANPPIERRLVGETELNAVFAIRAIE